MPPAKYSEEELVMLLHRRERAAFEYLYENYSSALFTVILNIVGNREIAADLLQESFVKIWKQADKYDPARGRLFTWMMRICRNSAIDMLRSKDFRQDRQNLELKDSVYDSESTEMKVEHIGLRKWVRRLRDDLRIPLELSYFEGYTHPEIAGLLAIPEGTVKTRIRTGVIQLRTLMNNGG